MTRIIFAYTLNNAECGQIERFTAVLAFFVLVFYFKCSGTISPTPTRFAVTLLWSQLCSRHRSSGSLRCCEEEENLRIPVDREVRREGAHPLWVGKGKTQFSYHKVSHMLAVVITGPAHWYAELAVFSPAVTETIASTHCTYPRRDGHSEWPGWWSKVVTNPSTNWARRSLTLLMWPKPLPLDPIFIIKLEIRIRTYWRQ